LPDADDDEGKHDQDERHGSGGEDQYGGHQRSAPLLIVRSVNGAAKIRTGRGCVSQHGAPLRVVRLTVPLRRIERRLASDVTSGRRDDLREAASWIASAVGAGVDDVVISYDRPIGVVARDVMTFLGWF
jgi:hypothetical protein